MCNRTPTIILITCLYQRSTSYVSTWPPRRKSSWTPICMGLFVSYIYIHMHNQLCLYSIPYVYVLWSDNLILGYLILWLIGFCVLITACLNSLYSRRFSWLRISSNWMVAHPFNSSTPEAETRGFLWDWGLVGLQNKFQDGMQSYSETLNWKKKNQNKKKKKKHNTKKIKMSVICCK